MSTAEWVALLLAVILYVVAAAIKEADLLVKLVYDPQVAADESWSRVQSTLLILRYFFFATEV